MLATNGKSAAGPDTIPPEVFRIATPQLSRLMAPLALKTSLWCVEPLAWQGGRNKELRKCAGHTDNMEHFRAILCSDVMGKKCQGVLRKTFLDQADSLIGETQFAGKRHLGVDIAPHVAKSFFDYTKKNKLNAAGVFVDITSAYYSAIRALALKCGNSLETVPYVLRSLNLPEDWIQPCIDAIMAPSCADLAGMHPHMEAAAAAHYSTTWFMMDGCDAPYETLRGTQPGVPLADVMFSFLEGNPNRVSEETDCNGSRPLRRVVGDRRLRKSSSADRGAADPVLDIAFADDDDTGYERK